MDKMLTISLRIENTYEDDEQVTFVNDAQMPAPLDVEDLTDWAEEHIYPLTGTGRTDGDSFYDVTVTACSNPALVGRTFAWGY